MRRPAEPSPVLHLASPAALCLLGFCAVNLVYTAIVAGFIARGATAAVVPPSVARRLVVSGLELTVPLVLAYNLVLSLAPLALLWTRGFRALTAESRELLRARLRGRAAVGPLILASLVLGGVYLAAWPDAMLPFEDERVRWFTDQVPDATPVDQALLVRAHYLTQLVADVRYTIPLLNAGLTALLVLGLAVYFGRATAWASSLAVVLVMLSRGPVFYSTGADGEVPAAVFGILGVLALRRRRFMLGIFLLWIGLLFKVTTVYFVAIGAALLVWNGLAERSALRVLRSPAVLVMTGFLAFYYLNYATYVARRGGTYVMTAAVEPFFVHPLGVFGRQFVTEYLPAFVLAVGACLLVRDRRRFLVGVSVALVALRCTARLAGGYYTLIFLPVAAWLVAELFVWLALRRRGAALATLPVLLACGLVYEAAWFVVHRDAAVTRRTMRWAEVVRAIDAAEPPGGDVLYRKASPKYDLRRLGRTDLKFTYATEDPADTVRRLTLPGARAYLAPASDLDEAAGRGLADVGFRALLSGIGPPQTPFVVWFKGR